MENGNQMRQIPKASKILSEIEQPVYYDRVRSLTHDAPNLHGIRFDGAGVVHEVGSDVKHRKTGDKIYYLGSPVVQGCDAQEVLVDERHASRRPRRLDFMESAAMPLTYATAF